MSLEFGEGLLSDLVTCDVSSYINSVFASSGEWSTTSAVIGAGTTKTTLQPAITGTHMPASQDP